MAGAAYPGDLATQLGDRVRVISPWSSVIDDVPILATTITGEILGLVVERQAADAHRVALVHPGAARERAVDTELAQSAMRFVERVEVGEIRERHRALGLAANDSIAAVVLPLDAEPLAGGAMHDERLAVRAPRPRAPHLVGQTSHQHRQTLAGHRRDPQVSRPHRRRSSLAMSSREPTTNRGRSSRSG